MVCFTTEKLRADLLQSKEETHTAIQEGMAYKQQSGKLDCELEGTRDQLKLLTNQVISMLFACQYLFQRIFLISKHVL